MGRLTTTLRRSLWLVLIVAAGGAVWSWRREAADASSPGPAEWPPLPAPTPRPTLEPTAEPTTEPTTGSTPEPIDLTGVGPEARSGDASSGGWERVLADGSCPDGYPIKANDNSGIFHVPGGRFYDRTKAERCYSDAAAAIADGYRQAKN